MALDGDPVRVLVCRLLAHQALPRTDELVRRLLVDTPFREAVAGALHQVGLEFVENVYADFISVRVVRELETPVFEDGRGSYWSNNVGLSGGAMALLAVVWSLLILPKRQRQQEQAAFTPHPAPLHTAARGVDGDPLSTEETGGLQSDPLGSSDASATHPKENDHNGHLPSPLMGEGKGGGGGSIEIVIERKTLEADFGHLFSSQIRFHGYLSELKRRGFIRERRGKIMEGPLLDVLVDYGTLAPRILEGALSKVLAARFDQPRPMEPQMNAD